MNREELRRLYDREYAASYDAKFLTSDLARADAEYEAALLSQWLPAGARWLDVACGTGFFLSQFPAVDRAGLDLSPAMLEVARRANPGAPFVEGSYLEPRHEWTGRWDLVSCMWYAYGLVDSIRELEVLVENLARWTAPNGRCFVPIADPSLIAGVEIPAVPPTPWPGEVTVTGILWSYREPDGRTHSHQIAPNADYMRELFQGFFSSVELVPYPPAMPGWVGRRSAIVATGTRRADA